MSRSGPFGPVLFDLDGTVADTYPGIVRAAQETFSAFGLPPPPAERVYPLTGKGVEALVEGLLAAAGAPADAELRGRILERYRQTYDLRCTDGVRTYPGIPELLASLPVKKALLTNKARRYTEPILELLKLPFAGQEIVAGDDSGPRKKLKPDPWPVQEALRRMGAEAGLRPLLVGDTANDVGAAHAADIECCAVRWGHGSAESTADADFKVDSVDELAVLLATRP